MKINAIDNDFSLTDDQWIQITCFTKISIVQLIYAG